MTDKSHVSMEQKVCVVCCKQYDSGSILLDRRLRESMERHTVTGWGMCPEHEKLKEDGYIALVACDPDKSTVTDGITKPSEAYRTGAIAHIKIEAFKGMFNAEPPEGGVMFCDDELINMLEQQQQRSNSDDKERDTDAT